MGSDYGIGSAISGILQGWQRDSNELNALGANATNQQNTQAKQKSGASNFSSVASKQLGGQQDADAKGLNSGVPAPIPMGKRLGDIMGTDNNSPGMPGSQNQDAFGAQTPSSSPPTSYSGGLKDAVQADSQLSNIRTGDSTQENTSGLAADASGGTGAAGGGTGQDGSSSTMSGITQGVGALSSVLGAMNQPGQTSPIAQPGGQGGQYQPTANMSMQQLMQQMQQQKRY